MIQFKLSGSVTGDGLDKGVWNQVWSMNRIRHYRRYFYIKGFVAEAKWPSLNGRY